MPKKCLIAIPEGMLEEADRIAKYEYRTRSDLIRQAIREYIEKSRLGPNAQGMVRRAFAINVPDHRVTAGGVDL